MWLSLLLALIFGSVAALCVQTLAARILSFFCVGFFTYICTYLGMPILNYGFYGLPTLVTVLGIVILIFSLAQYDNGINNSSVGVVGGLLIAVIGLLFLIAS
jgi:hypothetical protein